MQCQHVSPLMNRDSHVHSALKIRSDKGTSFWQCFSTIPFIHHHHLLHRNSTMSQAKFDTAVKIVQSLPKDGPVKPTQDDQLIFYKYYKQATIGDCNTSRPGILDFVGKAKWDAWDSVKGTSKEDAMTEYVKAFKELLEKTNNEESKKYIAEIDAA
ncbi:hypothetical protein D9758_013106 [Tetrapyrgos nigripes]|uniref:ACB domain-containing protein n=1 Tax=Tetrapyrgos nigripes TaxID=182062 RepID=A0A8H5FI00_9AGAR|nr:hypothetical protein D9758_013106 [Tetrapyrgos nigripes]